MSVPHSAASQPKRAMHLLTHCLRVPPSCKTNGRETSFQIGKAFKSTLVEACFKPSWKSVSVLFSKSVSVLFRGAQLVCSWAICRSCGRYPSCVAWTSLHMAWREYPSVANTENPRNVDDVS
eukprot:4101485-Amphidinium_carterae.1